MPGKYNEDEDMDKAERAKKDDFISLLLFMNSLVNRFSITTNYARDNKFAVILMKFSLNWSFQSI